ncbi:GATOR complex protein WDR24-like [Rhopalosiphum padi]|uniref:GATOR complex protein WDR24-like n=1 Tax=Rhopalosiphum padi TaxID=40932 RepID=UPI00298DFCBF|nr:GATOR complex protein WDR24-like [Rhopalosiphum padi]
MLCLNNQSKIKMRLNIQRHRQKLLQCLQNSGDTILKPKIKLVSNSLEKIIFKHNVKPKIALSTELLNRNIKPTKIRNHKTISTDTLDQLQPNIKVNVEAELPSSNIELKQKSISNNEIIDPLDPPKPMIKNLKEQLIEELNNSSSESEDTDDNISVGSNENWSEIFQTDNKSNVYNNVNRNSIPDEAVKYYEQEQPVNEKSKEQYSYYLNSSKKNQTRKSQHKSNKSDQKFRKPHERFLHNAKERASREEIAKKFDILRKYCSYLNSNRRVPSKHSILLAAKKEVRFVKTF